MCSTLEFEVTKSPMREEVKILGLKWDMTKDELHVDVSELSVYLGTLIPTKRSLLGFSSKLFDLLGSASPFVVRKRCYFRICVLAK